MSAGGLLPSLLRILTASLSGTLRRAATASLSSSTSSDFFKMELKDYADCGNRNSDSCHRFWTDIYRKVPQAELDLEYTCTVVERRIDSVDFGRRFLP